MRILERPIIALKSIDPCFLNDDGNAHATFLIEGSRTLAHQIASHKIHHHLENSQCYIHASEPEIIIPPEIFEDPIKKQVFIATMKNNFSDYQYLIDVGVRKEDAKFVLPNAILTRIEVKANFKNWKLFYDLNLFSLWEINLVSTSIWYVLNTLDNKKLIDLKGFADIVSKKEFGALDGN